MFFSTDYPSAEETNFQFFSDLFQKVLAGEGVLSDSNALTLF
jgi:hypothetical protein